MKRLLPFLAILAGCAPHDYAPAPGTNPLAKNLDTAQCQAGSGAGTPGLYATGSLAAAVVVATVSAVGRAVATDIRYQDCMQTA